MLCDDLEGWDGGGRLSSEGVLFTYCRTVSNRHLVTLAELVSGPLLPMLKSTDGSSPGYEIT